MKHLIIMFCLVMAAPIFANSDYRRSNLDGVWKDRYDDDKIEIRDKRYGLEVRKKGLFRKKRLFEEVDYNRYADRDGNIIEVLSNNQIVWKNRRSRSYKTFYKNGYYNFNGNRRGYNDRRNQSRYNNDRRYDNNRRYSDGYNDSRYQRQNQGQFDGRWRCANNRKNIFIETRGDGFRVRRSDNDRWYDYNRDPYESNVYRGKNGEKYVYKDNSLIWYGSNSCDILRFGRY